MMKRTEVEKSGQHIDVESVRGVAVVLVVS